MTILKGELHRLRRFTRRGKIREYLKNNASPKLNLGCGNNIASGWLNVDKFNAKCDIYLNAYDRFPFSDNSFSVIYSEHMLEHINVLKVPFLLSEVYRVLKPSGLFRVTVPDLELFAKKYVEADDDFFKPIIEAHKKDKKPENWMVRSHGSAFMTRANYVYTHHRWMYDFVTLKSYLEELGFSKVVKQTYGNSLNSDAAKMDWKEREIESLYVDAIK